MKIWKRNAVVGTVVLFVCVALYLSWSYNRLPDDAQVLDPVSATKADPGIGSATLVDDIALEDADQAIMKNASKTETNYFDEARLSRQQARDTALSILKDAADRENATQDIRDKAATEITTLAENAMSEARIESLVVAKGYSDCVAYKNADGINVVVSAPADGLLSTDVSKIKDIIVGETKLTAENITIVEVKA